MDLNSISYPASVQKIGSQKLENVASGQTLKIKLEGQELLSASVPRGKKWSIGLWVEIKEEDA